MLKSSFLNEFCDRGYYNDCTDLDALDTLMAQGPITAYLGFDLTAKSLHAGSLVQLMILRLLQRHGHKPIILLGGGTTKIGDPSGKDKERDILDESLIAQNKESLRKIFAKFVKFGDDESDAIIVDNDEWLSKINYLDFLREYGAHFSINKMLTFESVKSRLDRQQPLSFLEFNYMILQAYDYVVLNSRYNCILQIGGSDQWGNIVNGIELNRRVGQGQIYGLTSPLLTTASGKKMGKSEGGAIWLNEDMRSVYDYWQFWRNADDQDVPKFLRMFTDLPKSELDRLGKLKGRDINEAKVALANEVTALCHGRRGSRNAQETARQTFEMHDNIASGLPTYSFSAAQLTDMPLYKLVHGCELCASGGAARRLITQNAVKLNDRVLLNDPNFAISTALFDDNHQLKLSVGKKKHVIVELSAE